MKKNKYLKIIALLSIHIIFGCKKENSTSEFPGLGLDSQWGQALTINVCGRVVDEFGSPIEGALVKGGNIEILTDPQGVFRLVAIPAFENLGFVKVEKSGYFQGSRSFIPIANGNVVEIVLLSKSMAGSFDSELGGNVVSQGVELTFPPGSINRNGASYSGIVNVSLKEISPDNSSFAQEMPGNLIGLKNDSITGLSSYGMLAVELTDLNGSELQLAPGSTAQVDFTIPFSLLGAAPPAIDIWSFDENSGYWKYEGVAVRQSNKYSAEVSHFSFWNLDLPIPMVFLNGRLINSINQQPVSGLTVIVTETSLGRFCCQTNQFGEFSGYVPFGRNLTISVEAPCGTGTTTIYSESIGPLFTNDTTVNVFLSAPISLVSGSVVDCNNTPVQYSYILVNGHIWYAPNGQFSFMTCGSTAYIQPYLTVPSWTAGALQTFSITGAVQNIGPIQVCSGGGSSGTLTDFDGNIYQTVQIGTQIWMKENLRVTHYANGDLIPNVSDTGIWRNLSTGAWIYFNNNVQFNVPYGKLYNWYTVIDPRNVCPNGWHVPTNSDWNLLASYLDPSADTGLVLSPSTISQSAGGSLKESGIAHWVTPNTGATNSSGFTALPGGILFDNGYFSSLGNGGYWWCFPDNGTQIVNNRVINYNESALYSGIASNQPKNGESVRCIKD